MSLYDEIMAGVLEKNAGYGYDEDEEELLETLEARDELLKTAADILETVDEINYTLGLEKEAGPVGDVAWGAATLGLLGLPYWEWYSHRKKRLNAEERLRKLQERGLIDRIMNKEV